MSCMNNSHRVVSDFNLEVSKGKTEHALHSMIARNDDVGTSYEQLSMGGGTYAFPTTAATMEVLSQHAEDAAAGLGARTVEIQGLSSTGQSITETVSLVGNAASAATTRTFFRVNGAVVKTSGTVDGANYNALIIRISSAGAAQCVIDGYGVATGSAKYGGSVSQTGRFSIPLGKTMHVRHLEMMCEGSKAATIAMFGRSDIMNASAPFKPRRLLWLENSFVEERHTHMYKYIKLPELTDVYFETKADVSSTKVSIKLDYFLE